MMAESRQRYNSVPEEDDRYVGGRSGVEADAEEEYEYDYDDDKEYDAEESPMSVKRSENAGRGGVNFTEPYSSRRMSRAIRGSDDRTAAETVEVEGEDDPANELQLRAATARSQNPSSHTASNNDQKHLRVQPAKTKKKRMKNSHVESVQRVYDSVQPPAVAHFVAKGNYSLKQFGKTKHFFDWNETSVNSGGTFSLRNGILTVHRPGLYFVYAQIYFRAHQDTSAFHIDRNEKEVAYCAVSNHWQVARHNHHEYKENTCFTSTVVSLQSGDTLAVVESNARLYSGFNMDKDAYSFLGLFRIGDNNNDK